MKLTMTMTINRLLAPFTLAACLGLAGSPAQAIRIAAATQAPTVVDTVSTAAPGTWSYNFSITNNAWGLPSYADSIRITRYELPYFADAGVTAIQAPTGWSWRINAADTFALGNGAQTLEWTATSVAFGIAGVTNTPDPTFPVLTPGDTLAGFSFQASYAPVKGPFSGAHYNGTLFTGDPAIPGSPSAFSAGLTTPVAVVPEPGAAVLMLAGLALFGLRKSRHA